VNDSRVDHDDTESSFERDLRVALQLRAQEFSVSAARPREVTAQQLTATRATGRYRVMALAACVVAVGVVLAIELSSSKNGDRVVTAAPTPAAGAAAGAPLRLVIGAPAGQLDAAWKAQSPTSAQPSAKPVASVVYRPKGDLRPPIVSVTLATGFDQAPVGEPISVGTRTGYLQDMGGTVATLTMAVDTRHELQIEAWGLSRQQLVDAAASVTVNSDADFTLPGLPPGLQPADVAPASQGVESRADFRLGGGGAAVLTTTAGGIDNQLASGFLMPGSGTETGSTTIQPTSVRGRPGLLRLEHLATSDGASTSLSPLSFQLIWDEPSGETVHVSGGVSDMQQLNQVIASIGPVDEATWQAMLARCPRPTAAHPTVSC
jgi:hypothetical protein